jgi:hypothetical protein
MTAEPSSPGKTKHSSSIFLILISESGSRKRQRRSKQDPQFIFDNAVTDETEMDTTKRSPIKPKSKPLHSVDSVDASADLYVPGDIVWCKLGSFPWWPALVVCL